MSPRRSDSSSNAGVAASPAAFAWLESVMSEQAQLQLIDFVIDKKH
jgi:hypothetical protein